MRFPTYTSPHLQAPNSVGRIMAQVLIALIPGTVAMIWYFGWGILFNIAIAAVTALVCESAMLTLRGKPARPFLSDLSATVTAVLLALALPALTPWWVTVTGTAFAIVVAKHLYGGLGHNPFNPAMVGYVVLLIAFPVEMTSWLAPRMLQAQVPGFVEVFTFVFTGVLPQGLTADAFTMATPLDTMKTQLGLNATIQEIRASPLFGDFGGRGWEWVGNWFFLGGLWLMYRRVITWHIPVATLGGLFFIALFFYPLDPDSQPFPLFHVFSGGAVLGAFFVATDPVSACTSTRGKLYYGLGIGILTYVIRTWGGYPDGVAFAVLLMNMAAPTIDCYTQPRTYGHKR